MLGKLYESIRKKLFSYHTTYGATDMLTTGRPDQYSTDLGSPRLRAVVKALVAVL